MWGGVWPSPFAPKVGVASPLRLKRGRGGDHSNRSIFVCFIYMLIFGSIILRDSGGALRGQGLSSLHGKRVSIDSARLAQLGIPKQNPPLQLTSSRLSTSESADFRCVLQTDWCRITVHKSCNRM